MSDDIRIEPDREADLPSIRRLLAELMEAMIDTDGFDLDRSVDNCRSLILDPAQYVFVAKQADSILGFINLSTRKTVMHPASSALIDVLVVSGKIPRNGNWETTHPSSSREMPRAGLL